VLAWFSAECAVTKEKKNIHNTHPNTSWFWRVLSLSADLLLYPLGLIADSCWCSGWIFSAWSGFGTGRQVSCLDNTYQSQSIGDRINQHCRNIISWSVCASKHRWHWTWQTRHGRFMVFLLTSHYANVWFYYFAVLVKVMIHVNSLRAKKLGYSTSKSKK